MGSCHVMEYDLLQSIDLKSNTDNGRLCNIGALHGDYSSAQSFLAWRERRVTKNLFLEPSKGGSVKWDGMDV